MTILYDVPDDEYRDNSAITYSRLKVYRHCPLLYRKKYLDRTLVDDSDTEAKRLGRAAHCLILEGQEAFDRRYTVFPDGFDLRTKERKEQWAAAANPLKASELATVERWALAFEEQPVAAALIEHGRPEVTVRAEYRGVPVQGRLDWYDPARFVVWDLKTVDDLANFEDQVYHRRMRDTKHYHYYRQLAWYRSILVLNDPGHVDWSYILVAVEKAEPYRCGVYRLGAKILGLGEEENDQTFRDLCSSIHTGYWPGNPSGVQDVELPVGAGLLSLT